MTLTVLVTGATGKQGGATARELLKAGASVRVLVRNPASEAAAKLKELGATLVAGDFDDLAALETAADGADAVFINVNPSFDPNDLHSELRHGQNVIKAARNAKTVKTAVYPSAILTGDKESIPGWGAEHPMRAYYISKSTIEASVRDAGFEHWTVLRPSVFMTGYLAPAANMQYPELLQRGVFRTALLPSTTCTLIDPDDIGKVAATAILKPDLFHGQEIDLGTQSLTMSEIAASISAASGGKDVGVEYISPDEAAAEVKDNPAIRAQLLFNDMQGQMDRVDFEKVNKRFGIELTGFDAWLEKHPELVRATIA